jgi:hypothetical protein
MINAYIVSKILNPIRPTNGPYYEKTNSALLYILECEN